MPECVCRICEKKFISRNRNGAYCSKECRTESMKKEERDKRAAEKEATVKKKEAPVLSIDEILKIAKKHGIRYGKAVQLIEAGVIK